LSFDFDFFDFLFDFFDFRFLDLSLNLPLNKELSFINGLDFDYAGSVGWIALGDMFHIRSDI